MYKRQLLAQYQGATPYPGKAVVEQGMTPVSYTHLVIFFYAFVGAMGEKRRE